MKKNVLISLLLMLLATINVSAEEARRDTVISFPGGVYRGGATSEGVKQGNGTYGLCGGKNWIKFMAKGKWESDRFVEGICVVKVGNSEYKYTVKKEADSITIAIPSSNSSILSKEVFMGSPGTKELFERLWDNAVLSERKMNELNAKKKYEYIKNKIFIVSFPFDEYIPIIDLGPTGEYVRSQIDENMRLTFFVIPLEEGKLLCGQYASPIRRISLFGTASWLEKFVGSFIYSYSVKGDSIILNGERASIGPKYFTLRDGKLHTVSFRGREKAMISGSKAELESDLRKQLDGISSIDELVKESEDRSKAVVQISQVDIDEGLLSKDLKEKYKTDLEDRKASLSISRQDFLNNGLGWVYRTLREEHQDINVVLQVTVSKTGEPVLVKILESNVDEKIENLCKKNLMEVLPRFKPAVRDGQFVEDTVRIHYGIN